MITENILFKDANMEVKEVYSTAGDYVLRLRAEQAVEAKFVDRVISLEAKKTKAFGSSDGKSLAKHFPKSIVHVKEEEPVEIKEETVDTVPVSEVEDFSDPEAMFEAAAKADAFL